MSKAMSKSHPYRIQVHCNQKMHKQIKQFAVERGLSESGAARALIDRAIAAQNDELHQQIDELNRLLQAVLHAATASRIFAAEAAQASGTSITNDEFKERILNLVKRYREFEG
ncbi:hypothetical protein MGA5115_01825 [Marinomonas gallaica]|uniref:Uncharacterized protein n=1 Tax=Marinomonas gallaica TaxID=1806667 RepID=A0A1C3JRM8_9GAMM|nr:hypothetical protein [Marinomonas gallaica]SBT17709.1 hypothetical protein MGA5115_01825 [Marinomonas gallaica]SBT20035.1 hypothetical protein MGA5116_00618 [Marinomonas gallaica]